MEDATVPAPLDPGEATVKNPGHGPGGNLSGRRATLRRHAGLLSSASVAMAWLVLARRSPDVTYHFAPLLVAASWGAARRAVNRGPRGVAAGLLAASGGFVISAITAMELVWSGALDGPTLWGGGTTLVETLLLSVAGAALSLRFVTRRRPGLLFEA